MAFIYMLSDPQTDEVRYVGQTAEAPEVRLRKHLWPSTLKRERCHRTNWLRSLLAVGLKPKLEVVEEVGAADIDDAERFWIEQARPWGFKLVNQQPGGDGWPKGQKRGPMPQAHRKAIGVGCYKASTKHRKPVQDQNGVVYESINDAARRLKINPGGIYGVLTGQQNHTKGFTFKYWEGLV